jgi:hypothetical protein
MKEKALFSYNDRKSLASLRFAHKYSWDKSAMYNIAQK